MFAVLFVCVGNICRSPALAATFLKLVKERGLEDKFYVDSCATTTSHVGRPADRRMCEAAEKRGVLINHKAQVFEESFFDIFDQILVVNREVMDELLALHPTPKQKAKIVLATHFSKKFFDQDIPDPYYGGPEGFDQNMLIAEDACRGLLEHLSLH